MLLITVIIYIYRFLFSDKAKRQNKIGEKTSLRNFLPVEQQDRNSV